ncbi:DUF6862 domain-containing protein [Rhizobium laguerreae]|uniref:DUF6862 domain-containing protein n=1 Tax=Rhizobium laguerreae TaxID=1076926 RepID=UPI00197FA954|nr:hypothetical protein [Rhizobium laguerreae]
MQFSVLRRASCPDRLTNITGKLAKLRNAARVSISAKGIAKAAKKRRFLRFADEIISVPKLHTGHASGMFEPWWVQRGAHERAGKTNQRSETSAPGSHSSASRRAPSEFTRFQASCEDTKNDKDCARADQLRELSYSRDKEIEGCVGSSSESCVTARTDLRIAAAEYLDAALTGDGDDLDGLSLLDRHMVFFGHLEICC